MRIEFLVTGRCPRCVGGEIRKSDRLPSGRMRDVATPCAACGGDGMVSVVLDREAFARAVADLAGMVPGERGG